MKIETDRLILRYWSLSDAEALYKYAKDERVGPVAGWPPHKSMDESKAMIITILGGMHTFAIVLKETGEPIGSIGASTIVEEYKDGCYLQREMEIGYWLGYPYWGRGLMTEAMFAMIDYLFRKQKCTALWCGYYEGNERSRRVQEKCSFTHHHTEKDKTCKLMGDVRTEHFTILTKEEYLTNCNFMNKDCLPINRNDCK